MLMIMNARLNRPAFSMIEMVLVVSIMAIIVTIAAPKFADAESGRSLQSAKSVIESDINAIKLRARATGKEHVLVFYPADEMVVASEGTSIDRNIVFVRQLTDEPLGVELSRTDIGGDENIVVNVYGELEKDFTIGLLHDGTEIFIPFTGTDFTRTAVTEVDTEEDIKTESIKINLTIGGLDIGIGL
ncbi:MAG TPA: prepilin-type N-terminal cleavage/methylation domain-containing protein [Phycisphaerales bacterium]|nr:prepilin-type N-terminal cleavage/methylation domain-containing protein [Phycisphaerales bacterium]